MDGPCDTCGEVEKCRFNRFDLTGRQFGRYIKKLGNKMIMLQTTILMFTQLVVMKMMFVTASCARYKLLG